MNWILVGGFLLGLGVSSRTPIISILGVGLMFLQKHN
jgi:hypothetical protein